MSLDADEYREILLAGIPNSRKASGGREVTCRCFYCPDSTDINHKHFYISIPQIKDEPSYFYCQKCHSRGLVSSKVLMEWGIFNQELNIEIEKHNKGLQLIPKNNRYIDRVYNLNNSYVTKNEWSDKKLQYINNRLGLNLTYQDILNNKIVLNIYDLLSSNNIQELSRDKRIVDNLNQYFLGFISYDNAFINMRRLIKKKGVVYYTIDKRYVNYNIFNKFDNTKRFYVNPTSIDLLDPNPICLHIAEGPMDILSIKYNLRKSYYNTIYASANGSGYSRLCKFFINNMKLINLEIHIYPDKDIDDSIMYSISNKLKIFQNPIYIHRNIMEGEKDFGVRPEKIKEIIYRIS